jgi:hypothetical protein
MLNVQVGDFRVAWNSMMFLQSKQLRYSTCVETGHALSQKNTLSSSLDHRQEEENVQCSMCQCSMFKLEISVLPGTA